MPARRAATTVIPMIGAPVAQAATPLLWNAHFKASGIDAVCVPVDLPPEGLADFVAWVRHARNVPGFVSTIPHKAALPALCDEVSPEVSMLGTANTIRKRGDGTLAAAMFDGHGMIAAIAAAGGRLRGATVAICGAGAAGGAIAVRALESGAVRLVVTDRDPEAAERLVRRLTRGSGSAEVSVAAAGRDAILVNASPAGSGGTAELPFGGNAVRHARLVADAVTDPEETPLLALARRHGRPLVTGRDMAARQAEAMRRFLGLE